MIRVVERAEDATGDATVIVPAWTIMGKRQPPDSFRYWTRRGWLRNLKSFETG